MENSFSLEEYRQIYMDEFLVINYFIYFFFQMRYGKIVKYMSNTSVFEHSGKVYSVSEDYMPQEIDISTLKTLGNMDLSGAWNRACTSHPKVLFIYLFIF